MPLINYFAIAAAIFVVIKMVYVFRKAWLEDHYPELSEESFKYWEEKEKDKDKRIS